MKKLFTVVLVLCFVGAAGAALVKNPEDFEDYPIGSTPPSWQSWGSGSGDGGWGAAPPAIIIDDGTGNQALEISQNPAHNYWSYSLAFSHDNALADIGNPVPGVDVIELHFDVISGTSTGIIKLEYYDAANSFPNPDNGTGAIRIDAWDPVDLSTPGHYVFTSASPIPIDTVAVTPVFGASVSGSLVIDNVQLIPEPATLILLGLGGLLIRKRN